MASLYINLPDEIYAALSRTAKRNRRSINNEAVVHLKRAFADEDRDINTTLQRIRGNREKLSEMGVWLTDEILESAKKEGRP